MKIAIVSDTHDNLANFKKLVEYLNKVKIEALLHCGDICAPGTLREGLKGFSGKTHIVFGNVDGDRFLIAKRVYEHTIPNTIIYGEFGEIEFGGKKIAFVHSDKFAEGLAATQKYDLVFYGHTHKPWEEKIGKTRLVNPGELAGMFYRSTFAVYDTKIDKLDLKILEKL